MGRKGTEKKYFSFILILIFFILPTISLTKADIGAPFKIPDYGCPMAHADRNRSDNCFLPIPKNNVGIVWHNQELISEKAGCYGLGFSGNGQIVACTYHGAEDNLVVYDFDGNILWSSKDLLNSFSFVSAPIVDIHNRIIACDNENIILVDPFDYDSDNEILEWKSELKYKGLVFSPVITESGMIILATKNGPIYVYNSSNGKLISHKFLLSNENYDPFIIRFFSKYNIGFFETINTPCLKGNRLYVLTHFTTGGIFSFFKRYGRLYAIDIKPDESNISERIKIAWHYDFGGPSGASPLLINDTIYFDGERFTSSIEKDPHAYALIDKGATSQEKWLTKLKNPVYGSFAKDPRGGFWIIDNIDAKLLRIDLQTGKAMENISFNELIKENGKHTPCSVITICENKTRPILIIAANTKDKNKRISNVFAIDLENNNSLLWSVKISEGPFYTLDFPFGQFPVVRKDGESKIFFSTIRGGPWAIGELK